MKNHGKKSSKPKDYDLNGVVDSMKDGFRKNLGKVKSSVPQISFETGNKDGRFYEDHQGRTNELRADLYERSPLISPPVLKNPTGDLPYYDMTSNGSGLDESAEPTPLEAAQMVKYVYEALSPGKSVNRKKVPADIGDWEWSGEYMKNFQGLDIGIFEKKINGKTTYVIVNAGSNSDFSDFWNTRETIADWTNNLRQPLGLSVDMSNSIGFAKKFVDDHPDANIIFAGHSKGGAEAAANAVATGKKAILFNPAEANFEFYWLDHDEYDGEMTSYVVDGEALDYYLGFMPFDTPAERIIIGNDADTSGLSFNERLDRHGIDKIIEILKKELT